MTASLKQRFSLNLKKLTKSGLHKAEHCKERKMETSKITVISEMVANYLAEIVTKELQEAKTANLEAVLDFVRNTDKESLNSVIMTIKQERTETYNDFVFEEVQDLLENNNDYVKVNDIDTDLVESCGLTEDVARNYIENLGSYDLKDWVKEMIDNL